MSDVYIVYSRTNIALVGKLVDMLSPRWNVWWDDKIVGDFSKAIEQEMPLTKCVIPVWSAAARESDYVRDELRLAKQHKITMIPVKIEDCEPPYGYGSLSSVDMKGWSGEPDHPGFLQLVRRLSSVVAPRSKPSRPKWIANGRLSLPAVFLSVSSYETRLTPSEAIKALRLYRSPAILISAYDMVPERRSKNAFRELDRFRAQGGFVLVDSGNYEASRRADKLWSPPNLATALADTPHDWAFCFDVMKPSRNSQRAIDQVTRAVGRDSEATQAPVLPIVHARKHKTGYDLQDFPAVIRDISERLQPALVAVPERELGPGLIARAQTVRRVREALNSLPFYQPLHLLGTGNPWSIAILAAAGADSFDGLEWCRVAVDRGSHRLNHFQHFDFFAYQARLANSPVTAGSVDDGGVDFAGKVAFHNLDYYAEFSSRLQEAASKGGFEAFIVGLIGDANTRQLSRQMPELF